MGGYAAGAAEVRLPPAPAVHAAPSAGSGASAPAFPAARACPTPSAPTPASSSPSPRRPYIRPCRCRKLHESTDTLIGTPLNPATYDYEGAVLFNAHASTLWARFTTYLRREIAAGLAGCVTGSPHCWPWWSAR
ncbi:replication initiator [Streptomyces mirabilis]|uniref:replication initiator n=1 Tax=Streptomyces mirabilis TaxID=68239 RepID=UPI003683B6D8